MRVVIGAFLVTLTLVIVIGCGGGGGGGNVTPPTIGSLAGYIYTDPAGAMVASAQTRAGLRPLTGAVITVSGQTISATTDISGQFQLDGIFTGTRQFYVECSGYTRSTFSMNIAEGPNNIPSSVSLETAQLKWMVMVYMAADNNLGGNPDFASLNLNQMEAAPDSPNVETLVLYDGPGTNDTRLYQIQHDTDTTLVTSPVIYTPPGGELDTGVASTLGWFVNYCETNAALPRAEHYLLDIWDHGSGWDSYYDKTLSGRAIGEDNTSDHIMRIVDIPPVLQSQPYPIDIIATDACLMSMLEVAYEWRACGDYLIGSEEETPGDGFNYTDVLSLITSPAGLQMTPEALANGITNTIYTDWTNLPDAGLYVLRLSSIDMRRLEPVASALDALAVRLIAIGKNYPTQLTDIYSTVEGSDYGDHRADLYDYADLLSTKINDGTLRTAASQLKTAISSSVTANYPTGSHARGISIYQPTKTAYTRDAASSYPGLQLSADTHWNEWLAGQP